jgi:hypothetical protein
MKLIFSTLCLIAAGMGIVQAQDTTAGRALTMAEYKKSSTFFVKDPDKDTYVKFDNTYILDKNGFGKPYFITGDDGKRKRIDLYKLILKEGRVELGTMILYSTEAGRRYAVCMPGYKADTSVWRKYFEDIHGIDKEEPFFVLKLSYVLSKELGFQLFRAENGLQGAAVNREAGTYGNDICFPGEMRVSMGDGTSKSISEVRPGDEVVTVDPTTQVRRSVVVKELTAHAVKNYAITRLMMVSVVARGERDVLLSSKLLEATPNHPMMTADGEKKAGELVVGDKVVCLDGVTGQYLEYRVWDKTETAGGMQPVYNIAAGAGSTFIMNGVMVMQKPSVFPNTDGVGERKE